MTIVGIGVDTVDVSRFAKALERTPGLLDRLLTDREREVASPQRLAARFAAKEAVAKALGAPRDLRWHDCEVVLADSGRPTLHTRGTVAAAAAALGVTGWQLSLTHDAGVATAFVIAEGGR